MIKLDSAHTLGEDVVRACASVLCGEGEEKKKTIHTNVVESLTIVS